MGRFTKNSFGVLWVAPRPFPGHPSPWLGLTLRESVGESEDPDEEARHAVRPPLGPSRREPGHHWLPLLPPALAHSVHTRLPLSPRARSPGPSSRPAPPNNFCPPVLSLGASLNLRAALSLSLSSLPGSLPLPDVCSPSDGASLLCPPLVPQRARTHALLAETEMGGEQRERN